MTRSTGSSGAKRSSRWPELLALGLAVVLLALGLLSIPLRRMLTDPRRAGVTGEVLSELTPAAESKDRRMFQQQHQIPFERSIFSRIHELSLKLPGFRVIHCW